MNKAVPDHHHLCISLHADYRTCSPSCSIALVHYDPISRRSDIDILSLIIRLFYFRRSMVPRLGTSACFAWISTMWAMNEKYPELIFGLVGAIGTDLSQVEDALRNALASVGYIAVPIKLSDLMRELNPPWSEFPD